MIPEPSTSRQTMPSPPKRRWFSYLILILLVNAWKCEGILIKKTEVPCNITYFAVSKGVGERDLVLSTVGTAGELDSLQYLPDPGSPLVVLLHGLGGSYKDSFNQRIANSLLGLGVKNLLVVDYGRLVPATDYEEAVRNTGPVGRELAGFLSDVTERLHLVGYSLGAHVAGVAGHTLKTVYNQTVDRILGLDPAYPIISDLDASLRLDPTDADFVMAVHTAGGAMGGLEPQGHVDFYPNGGLEPQPHCSMPHGESPNSWGVNALVEIICSHSAAYEYLADSPNGGYTATRCPTWDEYMSGDCMGEPTLPMGFNVPNNARGRYFLSTRKYPPLGEPEDYPDSMFPEMGTADVMSSDAERRELDSWGLLKGLAILSGQIAAIYVIYQYTPY